MSKEKKTNVITIPDDIAELLALAGKKNIKISGNDIEATITRLQSILADGVIKQTVTKHKKYMDKEGNSSSSAAGLVIQINRRISVAYGVKRAEMNAFQLTHASLLLRDIAEIIVNGENNNLTRPKIKTRIYEAIDHSGADYHWRCDNTGESA